MLAGEGMGPFLMRVVAPPRHALPADDTLGGGDVGRRGLADTDEAVLVEVLGGRTGRDDLAVEAHLAHLVGAHAGEQVVHRGEQIGDPCTAGLGEGELELREPLEDAAEDEVHQRTLRVERDLEEVHERHGRCGLVGRRAGAAVGVDGDVHLLAHLPQTVVVRVVERLDPVGGRGHGADEDATAQTVLLAPDGIGDRIVDVVDEDLTDTGATLGRLVHVVDHPAVVGAHTGETMLVLIGLGRLGEQHEAREEGRNRVRVDDLGHHAIGELIGVATIAVPVADAQIGVLQILEGVLVLLAPGIEVGDVLLLEVLAVLSVTSTGMCVCRDDDVVIIGSEHGESPWVPRRACADWIPDGSSET